MPLPFTRPGERAPFRRGDLEIREDQIEVDSAVRYGSLKNFPNTTEGRREAYRFGLYCLGVFNGDYRLPGPLRQRSQFALARCKSMGIPLVWKEWDDDASTKVMTDKNNSSAGFLVPDEFQNTLIDLREKYGVFRRNARVVPMASDSSSQPRRRSGVTTYYPDEGGTITDSDMKFDRVKLTARKLAALTKISSELSEDSVISIADQLAFDIAWAFANAEDSAGFNGDGTSNYGGMVGVIQTLKNVSATPTSTISDVLGIYQTTHNSYASITLSDFNQVVGLLPEFADTPGCKWYCSRLVWGSVLQRLATAAGGNRVMDIQGGAREKEFLGYPVEVSQVMPKVYAANQIVALFGDLSQAAYFGERREVTIALSEHRYFENDLLAIRGTERYDVNVHDVGENANGTARDAVMGLTAGPVCALMLT